MKNSRKVYENMSAGDVWVFDGLMRVVFVIVKKLDQFKDNDSFKCLVLTLKYSKYFESDYLHKITVFNIHDNNHFYYKKL